QMIAAFERLCEGAAPSDESPGEMDVYITGTDLDGHTRRYLDALGSEISDKDHRVVFHLQHRPGRKSLGIPKKKSEVDAETQAAILGTIARITASFPLGFPPIRAHDLSERVRAALNEVAEVPATDGRSFIERRSFVDGGVLANKPFGPMLRAIFYRMPEKLVDRRLFYIEPDPEPAAGPPKEGKYVPVAVGVASLTGIPGHQGIADDLEKILEHNERIRWLTRLKKERLDTSRSNIKADAAVSPTYLQTRIECVARSLVLNGDAVPSALDYPKSMARVTLLDHLLRVLTDERIANDLGKLNPFDVVFHLRRAFLLLYEFYDDLEHGEDKPFAKTAMRLMGRVIKVLKIVLDTAVVLRDCLVAATGGTDRNAARTILDEFIRFLAANAPWWGPLHPYWASDLKTLADNEQNFFSKEDLSKVVKQLSVAMEAAQKEGGLVSLVPAPTAETILDQLATVVCRIVEVCDGKDDRFRLFDAVDQELYPLEFASGVYELDEVQFVRISPADAQVGLSKGDPHAKVTGDECAHFSAFLRRDWRSNDILQGRFDGICQIVSSLLDDNALHPPLPSRADSLTNFLAPNELKRRGLLTECFTDRPQMLLDSWKVLRDRWKTLPDEKWTKEVKDAARAFREQLIRAGQEEAFSEDAKRVYQDLYYQDMKFGRCRSIPDEMKATANGVMINASANEGVIEAEARRAAEQALQALSPEQQWKAFTDMSIGSQNIVGPNGGVPHNVVGEYVTLAYLMFWGMLHQSLGQRAAAFLDHKRVKLFFHTPVLFIYYWLSLVRQERATALGVIA